ncbi:twin-arginine translocation signal domain-containing protein [Candidatus Omnitrophota bacterium]
MNDSTKKLSRRGFLKGTPAGIGVWAAVVSGCSRKNKSSIRSSGDFSLESVKKKTPEKLLRNAKIVQ